MSGRLSDTPQSSSPSSPLRNFISIYSLTYPQLRLLRVPALLSQVTLLQPQSLHSRPPSSKTKMVSLKSAIFLIPHVLNLATCPPRLLPLESVPPTGLAWISVAPHWALPGSPWPPNWALPGSPWPLAGLCLDLRGCLTGLCLPCQALLHTAASAPHQ